MTERTTVRLPEELLHRAKRKAVAEGRTLTALIEEGLRHVVAKKRLGVRTSQVILPIHEATSGPMPGVDITDGSAMQEMDDLEYVERMKHLK